MATTTNYSWTTPDDTALVKDGASAIRTLGSSVDTTVKNLNPETTLGDIAYRSSTANTNTRLALGTAGQVLTVNSGATAPEWATVSAAPGSDSATVSTSQTVSSATYTDLATSGPAVTITTGTKALVIVSCQHTAAVNIGDTGYMSYAVSGATTIAAADAVANVFRSHNATNINMRASSASRLSTLTAGSNTFTAKYRNTGNTAGFQNREICVINLGS
jgi:hypothetical protein